MMSDAELEDLARRVPYSLHVVRLVALIGDRVGLEDLEAFLLAAAATGEDPLVAVLELVAQARRSGRRSARFTPGEFRSLVRRAHSPPQRRSTRWLVIGAAGFLIGSAVLSYLAFVDGLSRVDLAAGVIGLGVSAAVVLTEARRPR